jgi:hypothetical protein
MDGGRGSRTRSFRLPTVPATLVTRRALHGLVEAGASQRLTVVVGSAAAGKSVLLADWAGSRPVFPYLGWLILGWFLTWAAVELGMFQRLLSTTSLTGRRCC